MSCGQVDVCVLIKKNYQKKLLVVEAKAGSGHVSQQQKRRLLRSVEVLCLLLELPGQLIISSPHDAT